MNEEAKEQGSDCISNARIVFRNELLADRVDFELHCLN